MKDINNFNSKGERNGYQVWYEAYDKLYYRGKYKNNEFIGYGEHHFAKQTEFYIK